MTQVCEADMTMPETPAGTRNLLSGVLVGILWVGSVLALGIGLWVAGVAVNEDIGNVPVRIGHEAPAYSGGLWPCVDDTDQVWGEGCGKTVGSDQWRADIPLPVALDRAPEADVVFGPWWTSLAALAGLWSTCVAVGIVGLLNVPVLRQIATGRGEARTDRRLAVAAGVVFVAWVVATVGPYLAAGAVIHGMETNVLFQESPETAGYVLPSGWLVPDLRIAWWPGLVVVLLVVLALAVRNGRRLAAQTEGLV